MADELDCIDCIDRRNTRVPHSADNPDWEEVVDSHSPVVQLLRHQFITIQFGELGTDDG